MEAQRFDLIEDFVYGTRCLTAIPFSVLWKALLDHLYDVNEVAAADALRRYTTCRKTMKGATQRLGDSGLTEQRLPKFQAVKRRNRGMLTDSV